MGLQPAASGQAVGNCRFHRRGAAFQGDHHGGGLVGPGRILRRAPDRLHHGHTVATQHEGQIGRAGNVVGNAAEKGFHALALLLAARRAIG